MNEPTEAGEKRSVYLQLVYGLSDAPGVTLQSGLALLQRDPVHGPLDLVITPSNQVYVHDSSHDLISLHGTPPTCVMLCSCCMLGAAVRPLLLL